MRERPDSREFQDTSLEDVNLFSVELFPVGTSKALTEGEVEVNVEGHRARVVVRKEIYEDDSALLQIKYDIKLLSDFYKDQVESLLIFNFKSYTGKNTIQSSIRRRKYFQQQEILFPSGTGVILYNKILELIRDQVGTLEGEFNHKVRQEKQWGMPDEKWHQVFDPIFEQRGYEKVQHGNDWQWQKSYSAEKKE